MAKVTMKHMRKARYCFKGVKNFFEKHGFDWGDFLENGIDEEVLAQTGDYMCLRLIELVHGKEE